MKITLGKSGHGLPCIEVYDPTEQVQAAVRNLIGANCFDDPDYQLRKKVEAFLQCDDRKYMLIEFWQGSNQEHNNFLNRLKEIC